jgi:hypothetical protein
MKPEPGLCMRGTDFSSGLDHSGRFLMAAVASLIELSTSEPAIKSVERRSALSAAII